MTTNTLGIWSTRQLLQELAARAAVDARQAALDAAEAFECERKAEAANDPKVIAGRAERDRLAARVAEMKDERERNARASVVLRSKIKTAVAAESPELDELERALDTAEETVKKLARRIPDMEAAAAEAARKFAQIESAALRRVYRRQIAAVLADREEKYAATAALVETFGDEFRAAVAAERIAYAVLSRCVFGGGAEIAQPTVPGAPARINDRHASGSDRLPSHDATLVPVPFI